MRRIVLSLALASVAALAACSGGGSVLSAGGNTANYVSIQPYNVGQGGAVGNGGTSTFAVTQGKNPPLTLRATAFTSTQGGLVNTSFRWTAALVNSGTYTNSAGNAQSPCPTTVAVYANPFPAPVPPATVPAAAAQRPIGTADLSNNISVQAEDSSVATFNAPSYASIYPAPAGTQYGTNASGTSVPSYCVQISAIAANGATGTITALALAP